jgi:hypothetical protein
VNVPPAGYSIEKRQRLSGESNFTTAELTGKAGQVVEYEIIVTNTGQVPIALSAYSDPNCEDPSGGASEVAVGQAVTFTCVHKLTGTGSWMNEASVSGNEGTGPKSSNRVVVNVPPGQHVVLSEKCEAPSAKYVLMGAVGPKHKTFTVSITATGVTSITFYLGGHKLKTLTPSQAKHGKFTIKIDPKSLTFKQHRLSVVAALKCGEKITRSSTFVHVPAKTVVPEFTG